MLNKSNKINIFCLVLISFFTISFLTAFSLAKSYDEITYDESEYDSVFDYEGSENKHKYAVRNKKSSLKKNPLELSDSTFNTNKNITFNGALLKVSFVVVLLLGALALAKYFFTRNRFGAVGSFIDEVAQKFGGGFSSFSNITGLKLKQTLILTPGQNIYLVEVDGKKLLLGGTQQGGVQFLADLTNKSISGEALALKQVTYDSRTPEAIKNNESNGKAQLGDLFSKSVTENPFFNLEKKENEKPETDKEKELNIDAHSKQSLKRRTTFRQSLLTPPH